MGIPWQSLVLSDHDHPDGTIVDITYESHPERALAALREYRRGIIPMLQRDLPLTGAFRPAWPGAHGPIVKPATRQVWPCSTDALVLHLRHGGPAPWAYRKIDWTGFPE